MRVIRKIGFFSLLFVATLFVQDADATLLPVSSYADGAWQGSRLYNVNVVGDSFLRGRIDFAVYDTDNLEFPDEIELANDFNMPGQYIYAYQIFNDLDDSDEAVAYFAVFDINDKPLDAHEDSIDSKEDTPDSGVESTSEYFTASNLKAVWIFAGGVLMRGEHSWFLVFSSDSAPVVGDYEISAESGEFPVPIPEPGTIALLGGSGALAFIRRRKSAWRHRVHSHN